ncbi:hypothetical protein HPB49_025067 [Dermacentor silvarum]|uniref:Uncharacterized protein n=1 Tax=Dermacentor silvarum TaxID=543639 RepID=A0ACB8C663_DERSI|nr:hypothetical protein HPB49_025067 [Dermacentor silvarum]
MTMRNYIKTQMYKRPPSGMNASAQRSSQAQHTRRHTYCRNATSSPYEPLLTWQTCNATPKLPPRLHVRDIVLLYDDDSPPVLWKRSRATEVLPGRNDVARACCLKLASSSVIRRPVQKGYLIEAGSL